MVNIRDLVDVTFEVPDWIREGLNTGSLFREGGVVRKKADGQFVMFLRESSGLSQELAKGNLPSSPLLSSQISSLHSLSTAALGMQVLNLGVSAIGFAVVISKLNKIQAGLQEIHEKLAEVLEEVQWISRKQDLEMIGKMQAALEIANSAVLASSTDLRQQLLRDAMSRLIESANNSRFFLNDLIDTGKHLSRSDLFNLFYRTWACSRIALVQCELLLDENNMATQSMQRMHEENEGYLYNLPIIFPIPKDRPLAFLSVAFNLILFHVTPNLLALTNLILHTTSQIAGYQQEIDFVQRNGLSWEEWKEVGDSEEPKLTFLVCREEKQSQQNDV